LTTEEAIPLLLDRKLSPVVALDTEFDYEDGPFPGRLRGLSLAGGTPEDGFFGCFWSFEDPYMTTPWETFLRTVLIPITSDPDRTLTMHPLSVDMKQARARGLTDADIRCRLEDTIAMSYIYDDNLPHSLKDLAYCILLKTTATSYKATQREINGIRKQSKGVVQEIVNKVWEVYKTERKKSSVIEAEIDPTWPGWQRLAMSLPPGLNKTTSKKTGRQGITELVKPRIEEVVQTDFNARAQDRFAQYGAEDAIYTLMLRYYLYPTFTPQQLEHLELETTITYPIVTKMEEHGLKIDIPLLADIENAMTVAIEALSISVIEQWTLPGDTEPFNPGSPDQVAQRMWVDWKLSPPQWAVDRRGGGVKPKHRRKKDGLCSTEKLILEAMEKKYEGTKYGTAISDLLASRRWAKLLTTYVTPILVKARNDPDGRIHSSFWPTGARSGRFSSSDPNVENIPRPTTMPTMKIDWALEVFGPLGYGDPASPPPGFVVVMDKEKEVTAWRICSLRNVFISEDGWIFVSADLSQIENRLTAFESRDKTMLALYREWDCAECKASGTANTIMHTCPKCGAAEGKRDKKHPNQPVVKGFVHGKDIHSATAAYLGFFEKYGADGRQEAKPVNHGATYGMGANTFSKKEGVPIKEAADRLQRWHKTYPGIRGDLDHAMQGSLHHRVHEAITEDGRVEMFDGHVRRFLAQRLLLRSGNFQPWQWEGTIREGVNVLMQGGTGVGMKRAMIAIDKKIHELGLEHDAHLVNQVHDELLYEVRVDKADEVFDLMIYEMEHAFPEVDVPVAADGGKGTTWGAAH